MAKVIRDYDKILKGALIMLCVVTSFGIIGGVFSYAGSIEPSLNRTFSVTGEGKVMATPDVAKFTFSVFNQGKVVADLAEITNVKSKEVIDYLKLSGVESDDIKSIENAVEPNFNSFECKNGVCPPSEVAGYTVRQTYEVKVRDFDIIGEILTQLTQFNINSVSQLEFIVDDKEKLESEAREIAVKQAKNKAKQMAKSGGFKVGKLISIYENNMSPITPYYAMDKAVSGRGIEGEMMVSETLVSEPVQTDFAVVEPGTQEIVINVNMSFSIK